MSSQSILILTASSRAGGETTNYAKDISIATGAKIIDLNALNIGYFDYNYANQSDDFFDIVKAMHESTHIIFATPVYWYAMSAQMKTFFDRLSDLLDIKKQDGRKLAGKSTYLIANGTEETLPEGFEVPFARTSQYFDMRYKGACYAYTGKNQDLKDKNKDKISDFVKIIQKA